ncbi:energy transducer TonB [Chryseobacterium sp. MEBOG06]|uniref:energy transducer TonB n=1 Tax=Chryseobacterium sp. MEBOG06 TaxID=2879938 RepID=UPI001F1A4EE7|nr:energy transducer TonB [Chryseobacterium sp. MEBOG06]UKB83784.1 energy transducer TonB [Chryseobacterium sp. MEBOG06]
MNNFNWGAEKILFILCLAFASQNKAQVLDEYPRNQDFYEGGLVNFYKEAHEYIVNNKLKECDENEIYQPRILVTKEAGVKLVKDFDTINIAKNKCAYNLSREVIKNLIHWKAAEVKGGKIGAVAEFIIYPKDLMSNYRSGYNANAFVRPAEYAGGKKEFNKDFHDNFMVLFEDYHINGKINLEFYINKEGHIVNPRFYPEVNNRSFNMDFLRTLARMKKVWKPALYASLPIKQRIAIPIDFSITFREDR